MLFTFTIFESITLGMVCVFYYAAGFGDQILLAAAITLGILLVLTLYTMQSKIDWSFLGPALITCLFVMIFWSWFTFWLSPANSFTGRKVISLFGAIIFSLFIIYDTNNIMKHFGVDDYIIAAIELYLDVINLFQYLLMLLSSSNN
jgi:FtsH-binding integral membrane protein